MRGPAKLIALSLAIIVTLVALLVWDPGASGPAGGSEGGAIFLYCAAGIKNPVAEVARMFEEEIGTSIVSEPNKNALPCQP